MQIKLEEYPKYHNLKFTRLNILGYVTSLLGISYILFQISIFWLVICLLLLHPEVKKFTILSKANIIDYKLNDSSIKLYFQHTSKDPITYPLESLSFYKIEGEDILLLAQNSDNKIVGIINSKCALKMNLDDFVEKPGIVVKPYLLN